MNSNRLEIVGITDFKARFQNQIILWGIATLLTISGVIAQSGSENTRNDYSSLESLLDTITAQAIANNPSLKASEYRTTASRANIGTIRYEAPQAAVEFYQAPIRSFPNPFKDQMEIDYSLQQMIPFPGKLKAMTNAEKSRAKMSEFDQQTTKQDLIRSVQYAFFELYLIDRQRDINSSSQALMRSFVDIARKQYELGMGRQTDILRAQTELSRLMNDSIVLSQSRQSTVAMINSLRSEPVELPIQTTSEISIGSMSIKPLDSLLIIADQNRPELQSMKSNIAMQQSEKTASKKEYLPDFMIRGMYKQMIDAPDDWSLMVGATLPVAPWSIGKYKAAVQRSESLISQAEADYKNMQNMVASQVKDAQAKFLSSQAQIDLIQNTTIPQAQQTMQSALAGYQTGKQEFLMLIDTQRMFLMAQQDYQMAVMSLLTNYTNLHRAIGNLR